MCLRVSYECVGGWRTIAFCLFFFIVFSFDFSGLKMCPYVRRPQKRKTYNIREEDELGQVGKVGFAFITYRSKETISWKNFPHTYENRVF